MLWRCLELTSNKFQPCLLTILRTITTRLVGTVHSIVRFNECIACVYPDHYHQLVYTSLSNACHLIVPALCSRKGRGGGVSYTLPLCDNCPVAYLGFHEGGC